MIAQLEQVYEQKLYTICGKLIKNGKKIDEASTIRDDLLVLLKSQIVRIMTCVINSKNFKDNQQIASRFVPSRCKIGTMTDHFFWW